ncbi:survival protein sure-like phosphatase/nucleotidase [Aspergillus minisclerotigenes]|uniref:Survival protein sure-like phosphatase/nucleotidase n=1 Tax=Aspergillus minisclerotigenes TaxID=656917 RepID=A0A5N6IVN9_9EURO|nr:survival protein sure-like phosphatase/nucleotidase [Aspergillus minisclerotigenes]
MHFPLTLAVLPLAAQAVNIISANDDGWAEKNIRTLYDTLTADGHSVVISAPAENKSGTGMFSPLLTQPLTLDLTNYTFRLLGRRPYEGSPAVGNNATQPRWNYVNSYPVTSIKYGIQNLSATYFNGNPDLAVTGPNVGANLGVANAISGTVGAACYAAHDAGIPAIAFSGSSGSATAWDDPTPEYATIYAQLATKVVDKVVAAGTPYLPEDVYLNVNFPKVDDCASVDDYKFVLSRIYTAVPLISGDDVETCSNDKRLPTETKVTGSGCYVSISVGNASNKRDANATVQEEVLNKLGDFLTCLS